MVPPRPRPPRRAPWLLAALIAAPGTGCGLVPASRLDDCAKLTQTLRAENGQLKDSTLSLRGENADLTQRAINDARKITALEDANGRLESSVQAYIDEREDLNVAFQRFKRQAQATAGSPASSALISRLKTFATAHPGTTFNPDATVLAVEADRLFVPGTDRLRADAGRWLDDCAAELAEPEAKSWPLLVAGHSATSPVRRTSTGSPPPTASELSLARAVRVRDALADRTRRDPDRIGVAGLGTSRPLADGPDPRNARIEIELNAATPRDAP